MASQGMVLVAGEALVDLIPIGATTYEAVLGGSPFNTAIGLGRLDIPTGYAGRVSTDTMGEALAERLTESRVDLSFVARSPAPSPLAFVTRGTAATGARYAFYLGSTAYDGPSALPSEWPDSVAHLHIGSFAATDGAAGDGALACMRAAQGRGTTSYDPNIRPHVVPAQDKTVPLVEERMRLSTVVKVSEEDLDWLYPSRNPAASAAAWAKQGPRLVVITRGGAGSTAYYGGSTFSVAAPPITVTDTVGAGDSFMSGLLAAMYESGALGREGEGAVFGEAEVHKWIGYATTASAITCTRKGANPPTRDEVLRGIGAAGSGA